MPFNKVGTPQKMTVVSGKCVICGENPGNNVVDGLLICTQCMNKKAKDVEEKNAN